MWERIKEIYASAFAIITTAWLLTHLILIKLWGTVQIIEENLWVLWIEIIMVSFILILALERFIEKLKKEIK